MGPRAFQRGETLYGRDREVMELLDLLIAERIVLLYSPSGAGKTSLLQAALLPELEREGFEVLPVMRVSLEPSPADRPGSQPANRYTFSLLLSLEETLSETEQRPLAELATFSLDDYLDRLLTASGESDESDGHVLVFDQFEEILTLDPAGQAAKAEFFAQVGACLRNRERWALFSMREEFLGGLDPYRQSLPTRLGTTYRLELLGPAAALEAAQEPARQAGIDLTDAAAHRLVDDLRTVRVQRPDGTTEHTRGPHVEPVQLQVVCRRLWGQLPAGDTQISEADVEAIGDVNEALAAYYGDQVQAVASQAKTSERAIREWFEQQLITEQGIRGQVLQGPKQSQGLNNLAIQHLLDTHLVRAEKRRGATWFELAHDRLIEPVWTDNARWREAHLSPLQRQAALWESQDRPASLLLRDEALREAERWLADHRGQLTPVDRAFVAACQQAAEHAALEAQARYARQLRQFRRLSIWEACGFGLGVLFVVIFTFTLNLGLWAVIPFLLALLFLLAGIVSAVWAIVLTIRFSRMEKRDREQEQ